MIEAASVAARFDRRLTSSGRPITPILDTNTRFIKSLGGRALKPASSGFSVFGDDRVGAVVAARTAVEAAAQVRSAVKGTAPARVIELRLDFLSDRSEVARLLRWLALQKKIP